MTRKFYMTFIFMITLLILTQGCMTPRAAKLRPLKFKDIAYPYPEKHITIDAIDIAYADLGSGDHTLLFLHGLAENIGFWQRNLPYFAKNYRVLAIDLPGFGKSAKGVYPYTMKFFSDLIVEFLDALNIDKVSIVGHSMGGQIGITFALDHRDRLQKLILIAPAGIEKFSAGDGEWLKKVLTTTFVKETSYRQVRANIMNLFYHWPEEAEYFVEERLRLIEDSEFKDFCYAVVRCVHGMLDGATSDKLDQIQVPTLIIFGDKDALIPNPILHGGFPRDIAESGHQKIPDSELLLIRNAGHAVQFEKPEEVNRGIDEFLRK